MKNLFLHISDRVAPLVRWVDFDLGQLDGGQNPPVSFPAVLVGFEQANFMTLGAGTRTGRQPFRLRVAFTLRERTHSKTDAPFRAEALEHLDTVEAIKNALVGTTGAGFSAIEFLGQSNETRADRRVYLLIFAAQVFEGPTVPKYQPVASWPGGPTVVAPCVHPEIEG